MMDIHPIKTNDDREQALLRIDALMNAEPDTDEGAELDVLVTLVEALEKEHFPNYLISAVRRPPTYSCLLFRNYLQDEQCRPRPGNHRTAPQ